ncbi:MAG TPA: hypothetical protein VMU45_14005 [Candidatus Eisenbacteria bacterium]|nr:hypothetical protein [Candidatus Eisenbacteria bacterium]
MDRYLRAFKGKSVVFLMLLVSSMALADTVTVNIVNSQTVPIYVSFTTLNQAPGVITWNSSGSGCLNTGTGPNAAYTKISAGQTCTAAVDTSSSSTRFCAATNAAPTNCMNAQTQHLTMVETNFEAASNPGCFSSGAACVWYDISVIPSTCTDALWQQNQCANTGGASYNLPVTLSCSNTAEPVYTCQGPVNGTYGPENYPSKCGNPNATCATGTPNCTNGVSAYFYPMFDPPENTYQPNAVCVKGSLSISFLSGS